MRYCIIQSLQFIQVLQPSSIMVLVHVHHHHHLREFHIVLLISSLEYVSPIITIIIIPLPLLLLLVKIRIRQTPTPTPTPTWITANLIICLPLLVNIVVYATVHVTLPVAWTGLMAMLYYWQVGCLLGVALMQTEDWKLCEMHCRFAGRVELGDTPCGLSLPLRRDRKHSSYHHGHRSIDDDDTKKKEGKKVESR